MTKAHRILEKMKDRSGAGCMPILDSGKVLLVLRGPNLRSPYTWVPPGGRIDPGETPHEAALRETREEVNVDLSNLNYDHAIAQPLGDGEVGIYTTFVYFLPTNLTEDSFDVKIDHESLDWGWFTPDEMSAMDLHPGVYYVLEKLGIGV